MWLQYYSWWLCAFYFDFSAILYGNFLNLQKKIFFRSGDECVVALCNQWYLDYGEPSWKAKAVKCLDNMNTYHDEVKKNFMSCLNWLHEYACSRTYGLGEF